MARDALAVLWRLRNAVVTEASRELAEASAREKHQAQRLDEHRLHIRQEQAEASGEHVNAFADWLPYARQHTDSLQATLLTEAARVRRLQEILVVRRTDAEAVAKAMQRRLADAGLIQARKEQGIMDEAAGRGGRR